MKNNWISKLPSRALALLLPLLLAAFGSLAQTTTPSPDRPEMADALRQSGKIYVVVLVVVIIVSGLLFYLVRLDRKVSRLEKEVGE
ncbi:CcmD family protein [Hymenobacter sp. RP-2-7]|uniref:CcmD family protein n=1 Tax=Hymenobacter polaris TaxID=2682546 RepID=A0A7Y0AF30_9BACT|nr:CcmD family protein [Hymenobacter polaris]NML66184.1 CcmD family protein [Hymenobacter polaris]